VALLAVLKAGGAYVPIDPEYPAERVAFMVKDAGAPIVLTQSAWTGLLRSFDGELLRLDADWARVATESEANPDAGVGAQQLAYMIYTSGSTGRPKGAMNTHRGLTNRLLWMQETYALQRDDRVLQKTPFSFDVSVWEFLWPLIAGSRLVVAAPGGHRDARYLVDLIERSQITTVHFVPSMLQVFLEEPDLERCGSLRRVICSGEALPVELLRRYTSALRAPLYNLYGPTEAAIDVTAWACDLSQARSTVPIGTPIANTQIYLLDAGRQIVPIGVTGELFIGGAGVGRGYRNRPDLTEQSFVADPFHAEEGARLYRTGDLARMREDGVIEYLGRVDHQVKIRGFRIELGEIESALLECPGVTGAVVVSEVTAAGDRRLAAYVTTADRDQPPTVALRERLARTLPDYMIPSAFVALDAIPRLPNGKIDRGRLPASAGGATHVPPLPGVEAEIAAIWEGVLRQAPLGTVDDFFALGGNSLSAGQVVSRIARQLNARVGIKDIFLYPTIRSLAAQIRRASGQDLPAVAPLAPQPHHEVSHAQRRFWIQDRLGDAAKGNSHPACFLIEGALDRDALRRAFDALVARHEILRTVFVEIDGQPRQKILAAGEAGLDFEETTLPDGADVEAVLRRIEHLQASRRMDLTRGPLFRVHIVTLGRERHICVCSLHHTVTDGWSVGVLLNDVAALYDAFASGQPDPLSPLAIQYKDYAAWLSRVTAGPESEHMRRFWRATLDGVPALALPADFGRAGARYQRASRRFVVDRSLVEEIESAARRQGATLFMAMLSSIKVLLYRHTAQEDFCVGTPVAGRVLPDLETQIGPYLNVLALRDRVGGDDTLASVLQAVRRTTLDAYAHQLYPFDRLVHDLQLKRDPGRNPLFDVGFTLQNQHEVQRRDESRHLRMTELTRDDESFEDPEAATDLWFVARNDEGSLAVQVVYNGALFRPERIDDLTRDLLKILPAAASNPDLKVKSIPLGASEKRQSGRRIAVDLGL
jgi:amino acid adenylation domain-containing protein